MDVNDIRNMDWNWLQANYPNIYTQRKAIVDERIKQKLNEQSITINTDFENDPNCILHAYLYHIGNNSDQNAQDEHKKILSFMPKHPNESINKSHMLHLYAEALHAVNHINIIVLQYSLEIDQITQENAYYNASFEDTLVLFHRSHLNQYDHCCVDYAKCKYYTAYPSGSKYKKLKQSDDDFIHNHKDITYEDDQPPSYAHHHALPPDIENMNANTKEIETALRRVDFCIGIYYIVMGGRHYFDVSHRGKFYKYITSHKLSKLVIYDELNHGVPH
eukprot:269308_1